MAPAKSPARRKSSVHAHFKQVTKLVKQHIAHLQQWQRIEDEAREVLDSMANFAMRLPILREAEWRTRLMGAIDPEMRVETARALVLKHMNELQRLSSCLEYDLLPELNRLLDKAEICLEQALSLVEMPGWDPAVSAGSSPMSACEQITHIRQLTTMFVHELWRKELIVQSVADCLLHTEDVSANANRITDAARLWPLTSSESFVDAEFFERTIATVENVLP